MERRRSFIAASPARRPRPEGPRPWSVMVARSTIALAALLALGCKAKRELAPAGRPGPPAQVSALPGAPAAPAGSRPDAAPGRVAAWETWVEVHQAGWAMREVAPTSIAWEGVDDVILFSVLPRADRTLDAATNGLTPDRVREAVRHARASGARVHVAVGGERSAAGFARAFASDDGRALAASLRTFVEQHALDGVVLDVEPLASMTPVAFAAFVRACRAQLGDRHLGVVVAPTEADAARLGAVAGEIDRVSIMSYLASADPATERRVVEAIVGAGVDRRRIGLGIDGKSGAEAVAWRADLVRGGAAGGLLVWEAGALCRGKAAPCSPLPVGVGVTRAPTAR
jgi:hypothetical protein